MNIKFMRESQNISQKELAERLEISQNALCQYEKGKRKVPLAILIKLSDLFGCTIDELVRGGGESE